MAHSVARRERRRLPIIGLVLSVVYIFGVVLYLYLQGQNPADLRLNELGDFLGGVSSPLAFLWLVLGFFSKAARSGCQARRLNCKQWR